MKTQLWAVLLVLLATFIASFGPIFLKKGTKHLSFHWRSLMRNYNLILGIGLYVLSLVFYIPALRGGDLSVLYPIVAFGYVFVCFLSIKFLKEKMNLHKWTGIVFIILGVIAIGVGS